MTKNKKSIHLKYTLIAATVLSLSCTLPSDTIAATQNTNQLLLASATQSTAKKIAVTAVGEVTEVKGTVKAVSLDKKERILKAHSPIFPKDTLYTEKDSYAGLRFTDGTLGVMKPETALEIDTYKFDFQKDPRAALSTDDHFKVKLGKGGLDVNAGRIARGDPNAFQVLTPAGKVTLKNPRATIAYQPKKGLAFQGTGLVQNSAGIKEILDNAYALVTDPNTLASVVTTAPAFLVAETTYSATMLQQEISTYGENTAYAETATYEEATTEDAISQEDSSDAVTDESEQNATEASPSDNEDATSNESEQSAEPADNNDESSATENEGNGDDSADSNDGGDDSSGGDDNGGGDDGGSDE